jgi:hypothetical protein
LLFLQIKVRTGCQVCAPTLNLTSSTNLSPAQSGTYEKGVQEATINDTTAKFCHKNTRWLKDTHDCNVDRAGTHHMWYRIKKLPKVQLPMVLITLYQTRGWMNNELMSTWL